MGSDSSVTVSVVQADATEPLVPIYRYLMRQPQHWLRQAFFVGRPKLPVARMVEAMHANSQSPAEAAEDWELPIDAVFEALDYYQRFQDVIQADSADELLLSAELAHQPPKDL